MYAVEMTGICKSFGEKVIANNNVSLKVNKGEVHAIVGENGAGKSTLMNILYGMYIPDSGTIKISGKEQTIHSPSKAINLKIGMVHQHFMLVHPLTVLENIILGSEPVSKGFIDFKSARNKISSLIKSFKINISLDASIESLSVGLQQKVEILKLLYRDADILILDEPTAVLTPQEIEGLFNTINFLKSEGKTIILITHKLSEVMSISDTITVLRHGINAGELEIKDASIEKISGLMIGEDNIYELKKTKTGKNKIVLSIQNIYVKNDSGIETVKDLSLELYSGEILGIAGVEGNGQAELIEAISCMRDILKGNILLNGNHISNKINTAHIPADRHKHGIIMDFSVSDNLILGREKESQFNKNLFLNKKFIAGFSSNIIEQYDIRPGNPAAKMKSLSGGNQQKAVAAREIDKNSELIIASHPTRGLDIKASSFVHNVLIKERDSGKAIMLVSSDLSEILKLSDRIAVIYNGKIAAVLDAGSTTENEIGLYMTGGSKPN
jgi:simple sugar transport system ATP-binding protein